MTKEHVEMSAMGTYAHGYLPTHVPGIQTCDSSCGGGCAPPTDCNPNIDWSVYKRGTSKIEDMLKRRIEFDNNLLKDKGIFYWAGLSSATKFKKWLEHVQPWLNEMKARQQWAEEERKVEEREKNWSHRDSPTQCPEAEQDPCVLQSGKNDHRKNTGDVVEAVTPDCGPGNPELHARFPWYRGIFSSEDSLNLHDQHGEKFAYFKIDPAEEASEQLTVSRLSNRRSRGTHEESAPHYEEVQLQLSLFGDEVPTNQDQEYEEPAMEEDGGFGIFG